MKTYKFLLILFLQALESEIVSHEPLIEAVANTAHHMVENKHYASQEVSERLDNLHAQLQQLKTLAAERRAKLLDAVESQMVIYKSFLERPQNYINPILYEMFHKYLWKGNCTSISIIIYK